jgi:hypothetical protein
VSEAREPGREPGEDRFDALEREHEERQRAAQDLAGMLGTTAEAREPDREPEASTEAQATPHTEEAPKPRDEGGRFIVGKADAGEKGEPVVVKPSMGHMIMAHIDNDDSYLQ